MSHQHQHPDDRPPPGGREHDTPTSPDAVAAQLDLATEASLSVVPRSPLSSWLSGRRSLEQSVTRHLTGLGLDDIAARYLVVRSRRSAREGRTGFPFAFTTELN